MATNVSFNSNALQNFNGTSGVIVKTIDHGSSPDNTINILKLAKAPRSTITSQLKQQKLIRLKGTIQGTSIAGCDHQIDLFKGYLIGREKNLDIDYNGSTRRYVATANKTSIIRENNLGWADFETDFICAVPYGLDTAATTLTTASGRTLATYSDSITVAGNAEWQTPIITVTVTAVTGATNASITIGNAANGQACVITRNWLVSDVLVIDTSSITSPVTVNGLQVVYTGALPNFNIGSQTINYSDTFTTRTFTYLVQNYNRWE